MTLRDFLARSRATDSFRAAVEAFLRENRPNPAIEFDVYSPTVKVERTLTKLLAAYPELPIEKVSIEGSSGCEFYRGQLRVTAGGQELHVRFHWDCKWKAQQQGWTDYFGYADQIRAAREFGYDCFRTWEEVAPARPTVPLAASA